LIKPPPAPSELVRIQDDSLPAYSDYLAFNERAEVRMKAVLRKLF